MQNTLRKFLPTEQILEKYFDQLWPICRSITGDGLRDSFEMLSKIIPLEHTEVPTGTKVFDWTVPKEWNTDDAFIKDSSGKRIVDLKNNLHVLDYSAPIDQVMDLAELNKHLYSLPEQPTVIPYLTSYYKERWGFCLTHQQRQSLKPGQDRAVIRSQLKAGNLTYGHCFLPSTTGSPK